MERNEATSMTEAERLAQALDNFDTLDSMRAVETLLAAAAELRRLSADARRYAWLRDRFLGADFAWGDPPAPALLIRISPDTRVWGDLDLTVDQAMDGK